ncbi:MULTISPECIES: hypothetical protein [Acetobacter]|uniref:Uncharacterized protein n=1 Tax=Acetobacter tropicalis TaxID=104102 RepID=A0A291PFZ9_9PROT|nr:MULTISPECIES: hypothetical protein [Acetobacter]ATJ90412.1 hypothetical protein CIW82_06660 [Acetobacter tropicalis]
MVDLSKTVAAKSDQLNADDLMGGPVTIHVEDVREGSSDQPIAIFYKGCNGKPFYPCKSMRRVLLNVWGKDGKAYAGKSMTLYRDPKVKFGGIEVGGIRISHMSGIEKDTALALQITKGSKKLYTVKPLKLEQADPLKGLRDSATRAMAAMNKAADITALEKITGSPAYRDLSANLAAADAETHQILTACASKNAERLNEGEFA